MPHSLPTRDSSTAATVTSQTLRRENSRFFEPPSSPPPTCPLPPTPISPSPIKSIHSCGSPSLKLPRLQVSSLDLRPDRSNAPAHALNALASGHTSLSGSSSLFNAFASPLEWPSTFSSPVTPCPKRRTRDDSPKTLHPRMDNGQIWWSRTGTQASPSESLNSSPVLQISSPSDNPRSKKIPHKEVAHRPMEVSSPLTLETPRHEIRRPPATLSMIAPLLQDELITSLPPWPYGDNMEVDPQRRPSRQRSEGDTMQRYTIPNETYQDSAKSKTRSDERISFCAVTNLEESHATKHVSLMTDRALEANALEPTWSWRQRLRRLIWIFITIATVLMGTGGILTGILWKLRQG